MRARRFTFSAGALLTSVLFMGAPARSQTGAQKPAAARELSSVAWKILADGIAESKASKRTEAIAALATLGTRPEAVRLVEACLTDRDPAVRQTATDALGEMKSRRSIPKLRQAMEDDTPEVSFTAARVLWEMGDRSGRSMFLEVLAGERMPSKGVVQSRLQDAKKKLHNPLALVVTEAKNRATAFLGPFGFGVSVAEEFVKDRSASGRALSATLLGMDRSPRSAEQLEEALTDKSWVVRVAAAKALGSLSRRDSIPKLRPLLDDDKDAVRYMAAAAMVRLRQGKSEPR